MPYKDPERNKECRRQLAQRKKQEGAFRVVRCARCGEERHLSYATRGRKTQEGTLCQRCAVIERWKQDPRKRINHPPRICPKCGKEFYPRKAKQRYCSLECVGDGRVTKTCPVCGKEFSVTASTADRYNVCSMECKRTLTKWATCERCGKKFSYTGDRIRRHCSEECRRPPVIKECETCHKKFRIVPSYETDGRGRFCSFVCYRRFVGETLPERAVRTALEAQDVEVVREYKVGRDVFDLYAPAAHLLIEVDGDYWHRSEKVKARDAAKSERARNRGYRVERVPEGVVRGPEFSHWLASLFDKHRSLSVAPCLPRQLTIDLRVKT